MQTIVISSLQDLPRAARVFLQSLGNRHIVAFYGAMGAGKTTFIKAVCDALGVTDVVNSPTFAIVNEYYSEKLAENVFHFDFYRIRHVDEVRDLGFDDYLRSGCFCLMEWPELVEDLLPDDIVRVTLSELPDGSRSLSF